MSDWCRRHRHLPVREQQRKLNQKLQGHDAYYGITGNYLRLKALRRLVERFWRKWLNRRNRERSLTRPIFRRLLQQYPLVPARVVHSSYGRRSRIFHLRNRML